MPPKMSAAWVRRKSPKMGARTVTDSLTPRRLRTTSRPIITASPGSLNGATPAGRKLKTASPPAAMETEMVRT